MRAIANEALAGRAAAWPRWHDDAVIPREECVWVFGSNRAGRHGAGAALVAAERFGARHGVGEGITGSSYAIPTKDKALRTLPLDVIAPSVAEFITFARSRPDWAFFVTQVGCGLAGYKPAQIAPLFRTAPLNCSLPRPWEPLIAD